MHSLPGLEFLVAIGIGALIGLERERSSSGADFTGIRTLPLVALLASITNQFFPNLLPIAFISVLLLVAIGYVAKTQRDSRGTTSAVAMVLTFIFGAMTTHSPEGMKYAVILGTTTMAILAVKEPLHRFANQIGERELYDTLKFLVIALVVLPLLPNKELDYLLGLNPSFVWLMVVFVSGLSLLAYILTRVLGRDKGIGVTGLLGGFVSSTATTMTLADHAKQKPRISTLCAFGVAVASIVLFPRIIVLVGVVNPDMVQSVLLPIGAMTAVGIGIALWLLYQYKRHLDNDTGTERTSDPLRNPFRIKPALVFGAVFAAILLVSSEANALFGDTGIYITAFIAAFAGLDAITITLSKLALDGSITMGVATTGIIIAVISNAFVKLGIAYLFGTRAMARSLVIVLITIAVSGLGVLIVL